LNIAKTVHRETKCEILSISKITYKFQVTIPKRAKERLDPKGGCPSILAGEQRHTAS